MSVTADYLLPQGTPPLDGDALDDAFQQAVVGITGLSGSLVRPRWQAQPPQQPDNLTNWAAVGVTTVRNSDYTWFKEADDGQSLSQHRQQELNVMVSFYGPLAVANANLLADGIEIPNNTWGLLAVGIKLIGTENIIRVPDITNAQWINRCDIQIRFRREVVRTYLIPTVLSSTGTLYGNEPEGQDVTSSFNVEP